MKFEVNILGCGAATPLLKRNPTAQLLNIHDKLLLVDCAEGTQLQLRRFKFKFQRITRIFISHLHGDHYLGLIGLMSSMHLLGRKKKIFIHGPKGLDQIIAINLKLSHSYLSFEYEFIETDPSDCYLIHEDNTLEVYSLPLVHRVDTTGFIVKEKEKKNRIIKEKIEEYKLGVVEILELKKGKDVIRESGQVLSHKECTKPPLPPRKYVFMSDTKYSEEFLEQVRGADLLYHESTFLEEHAKRASETFHCTAKQAATFASKAEVKKLLLGHFSSRYTDIELFKSESEGIFSNVHLAHDGLSIRIE